MKVIKPWWAEDSDWVKRFEREAQLLAWMSDPGIVQVYDIGDAEEGPYYVAELVDGESLSERLLRGPIPPAEACSIAEGLARALGSAHAEGVVHCDVKPANVMLTSSGQVKVGDFGVARLAGGTSQALTTTIAGTPRYMAPEQARGRPATPATDVYSAGVVLYEMLAGRPPFEHGSPVELGLRHLQDEPPALSRSTDPALRDIVARALAKDPSDRYPDGATMAGALHVAAESIAAGGPRRRASSTARRRGALGDDGCHGRAHRVHRATHPRPRRRQRGGGHPRGREDACRRRGAPAGKAGRRGGRRRRRLAGGLLAAGSCALVVALLIGSGARTTVPPMRGLPVGGVLARAQRTHVRPAFSRRYADSQAGLAIAQTPAAGARVSKGSTVDVVLSAGPPPVRVPAVVGQPAAAAEEVVANAGLRYGVTPVSAPGSAPGEVTRQSPGPSSSLSRGSTVELSVAEAPRWRTLTTFSGVDDGHSVPFRIRGHKWRVSYAMSYLNTCLLIITCLGPSAQARNLENNSGFGEFELGEGSSETHVFEGGPGLYEVEVSGGHDSARWSMTVEDYY